MKKKSKAQKKVKKVMAEFKHKKLRSSSSKGPKVKSKKQALAIAYSESKKPRNKKGG